MPLFPNLDRVFLTIVDPQRRHRRRLPSRLLRCPSQHRPPEPRPQSRHQPVFACDSLAAWWERHGRPAYPNAQRLLLLCDGGGSNASNRYIFKYHLERLADRLGLELRIAHYPPYCSKYNPIEHRFFPHVTRSCQGLLLTSLEVTCQAMARASTRQGLRTTVDVLTGDYPLKERYPED